MKLKYVLIDLERTIGTGRIHFWKQNKHGYTTAHGEAGRFEFAEAQRYQIDDIDCNTRMINVDHMNVILRKYGELD